MASNDEPSIGSVAFDEKTRRFGELMDKVGQTFYLRPLGGGREWSTKSVRLATTDEELRAKVAAVNTMTRRRP